MNETPANYQTNVKVLNKAEGMPALSRTEILQKLAECIDQVHSKLTKGRLRKGDKERQVILRTLGYLSGTYLQGYKDLELEELNERIEKLEALRLKE